MLQALPTIRVQRLFALAVGLKISFAVAGYLAGDPLWLGMAAPMAVMILYMYVGYHKRESDVSEDKFADSCYYLGFIFTIVSIIMCLIDVPKLSPGRGMYEIAMRFGTAMISTVLGMIVRVYLVSFRKDTADSIKDVEASLIETTRAFTLQMQDTVKNLQIFEHQVIDASKASVAGVQLQVEALGRNFAESLDQFYLQVSEHNQSVTQEMLLEVKRSTASLAESVTNYSGGMQSHLQSIENQINQFAGAVKERLDNTTFPDDFFVQKLQLPLDGLKSETARLADSVRGVTGNVVQSSVSIAETLKSFHAKTKKAQDAMGTVLNLSEQQAAVLRNAELQGTAIGGLTDRLEQLGTSMQVASENIGSNTLASTELAGMVSRLAAESHGLQDQIKERVSALGEIVDQQAHSNSDVIRRHEAQTREARQDTLAVMAALEKNALNTADSAREIAAAVGDIKLNTDMSMQVNADILRAAQSSVEGAVQVAQRTVEAVASIKDLDAAVRQQASDLVKSAQQLGHANAAQSAEIADAIGKSLHIHGLPTRGPAGQSTHPAQSLDV